jgi:thiamine biosynthesis lipoprotein
MRRLFSIVFLPLLLTACAQLPKQTRFVKPPSVPRIFQYQKESMHTLWSFTLVADSEGQATEAFDLATAEIDRLDDALAMWKPKSETAAANKSAGSGKAVEISSDLAKCLAISLEVAKASGGAFDPSVGPLTTAWYYSLQKNQILPAPQIRKIKALVDYRLVGLDMKRSRVSLPKKGMMLDLGGIAKGYAQDKAAAIFRAKGIKNFLMNAGGQIYAAGSREDGKPWKLGVEHPRQRGRLLTVLEIKDACLATSGDYEQFSVIHGRRYHHILDPKTGQPTLGKCISATSMVHTKDFEFPGAWSDALGTAAFVLGPKKGKKFLQSQGASGVLVSEGGAGSLNIVLTDDLAGQIELNP